MKHAKLCFRIWNNFQDFSVQKGNVTQLEASEWYPDATEDFILQARSKQGKIREIKDRLHNKQKMNLQTTIVKINSQIYVQYSGRKVRLTYKPKQVKKFCLVAKQDSFGSN